MESEQISGRVAPQHQALTALCILTQLNTVSFSISFIRTNVVFNQQLEFFKTQDLNHLENVGRINNFKLDRLLQLIQWQMLLCFIDFRYFADILLC